MLVRVVRQAGCHHCQQLNEEEMFSLMLPEHTRLLKGMNNTEEMPVTSKLKKGIRHVSSGPTCLQVQKCIFTLRQGKEEEASRELLNKLNRSPTKCNKKRIL